MKTKTINKIIYKKMNDWIDSIQDNELKELVIRDVVVTGGCIASMYLQEKVNDYDVYFKTLETTHKVAKYYSQVMMDNYTNKEIKTEVTEKEDNGEWFEIKEQPESKYNYTPTEDEDVKYRVRCYIKSDGTVGNPEEQGGDVDNVEQEPIAPTLDKIEENEQVEDKVKYKPVYITSNAITLSHKLQIVIRFYGEPEVIHANYDFQHVTNYWTFEKGLVTNVRALECILSKELLYRGSRYPLASIIRTRKFIQRGWSVNAGQYVKMVYQLNDLNLNDMNVLEEQLTGVDVAYFHNLINICKKKVKEDKDLDIRSYFLDVIEKIFDK